MNTEGINYNYELTDTVTTLIILKSHTLRSPMLYIVFIIATAIVLRLTLKIWTYYPNTQCAAVTTRVASDRDPPHAGVRYNMRSTV